MEHLNLGTRMKENYENRSKTYLIRRMPVILRLDMCHGHSFTKKMIRPFDELFMKTMQETAKYLCSQIQGCKFAYTQSDEISLLLIDYEKFETEAWFDYSIQKMCSVAASMASAFFNNYIQNYCRQMKEISPQIILSEYNLNEKYLSPIPVYENAGLAVFDCRAFNIPKEEVNNYFYWRQLDASRNSIQMLAQSLYSHKELNGINCKSLQDKMFTEKGINWNDLDSDKKRGACVYKTVVNKEYIDNVDSVFDIDFDKIELGLVIDTGIPLFNKDTSFIEKWVYPGEKLNG